MGGMLVLEYAYFGKDYVRTIVPIATSSRHSAWGISWGEGQRQSIYYDYRYDDGYYSFDDAPSGGLGAARMAALLTYRSRDSFESRFGRNTPDTSRRQYITDNKGTAAPPNEHWVVHNDGHRAGRNPRTTNKSGTASDPATPPSEDNPPTAAKPPTFTDPQFHGATALATPPPTATSQRKRATTYFSAQSYLRYQAEKFVKRFDSNCYIAITRKLDTHDVSRHRADPNSQTPVADALSLIQQPTLVIGIESDGLFTYGEQQEIAAAIPESRLRTIDSPEGHDAFLLQFEQVNRHILDFFRDVLPNIMEAPGNGTEENGDEADGVGAITKTSTFGEAEVEDITAW